MKDLIKIREEKGRRAVSARELHEYLEINTRFDIWINRMFAYGFEEDEDYRSFLINRSDGLPGKPRQDFVLTIEAAKEICMLQRSDKGKVARRYFIEVEKKYNRDRDLLLKMVGNIKITEFKLFYRGDYVSVKNNNGHIMVNMAQMAQILNKNLDEALNQPGIKNYIHSLIRFGKKYAPSEVLYTDDRGTWIMRDVSYRLCQEMASLNVAVWLEAEISEAIKNEMNAISPSEILLKQSQILHANDQRIRALEKTVEQLTLPDKRMEEEYFTVKAYGKLCKMDINMKLASKIGRKASIYCINNDITIKQVADIRYGVINAYPVEVLDKIVNETVA